MLITPKSEAPPALGFSAQQGVEGSDAWSVAPLEAALHERNDVEPAPAIAAVEATPVTPHAEPLPDATLSDLGHITSQWPPLESAPVITGRFFFPTSNSDLPLPPKIEILIGRSDPDRSFFPDIDLGGQGKAAGSISRRHARLLMQGVQVLIEDLNSTNSTYLNKVRIEPGKPAPLKPGDELRLGGVTLVYYAE